MCICATAKVFAFDFVFTGEFKIIICPVDSRLMDNLSVCCASLKDYFLMGLQSLLARDIKI